MAAYFITWRVNVQDIQNLQFRFHGISLTPSPKGLRTTPSSVPIKAFALEPIWSFYLKFEKSDCAKFKIILLSSLYFSKTFGPNWQSAWPIAHHIALAGILTPTHTEPKICYSVCEKKNIMKKKRWEVCWVDEG